MEALLVSWSKYNIHFVSSKELFDGEIFLGLPKP